MEISKLSSDEKRSIGRWRYSGAYAAFNYAMENGGWIDCYCTSKDAPCYSCKKDGVIVGVFLFIPEKNNEFRVLVNPEMLNRGYGKKITRKAIEIGFQELQYRGISLIVRKEHEVAISLYRQMGFRVVGETIEKIEGKAVDFHRMYLDFQ